LRLIYVEQRIISNLQQIKDLLSLNAGMDVVCRMGKVFQLIYREQSIILS
jgi:hypothetical protein